MSPYMDVSVVLMIKFHKRVLPRKEAALIGLKRAIYDKLREFSVWQTRVQRKKEDKFSIRMKNPAKYKISSA